MQYKTFLSESKAIDAAAGIYEAMISTEGLDRDSDILTASGANLSDYEKNPVVLYAHNYMELPVAKAIEIQVIDGIGLRARFQFPERGVSEKADTVHKLWAGGFLNATSVGFQPKQVEPLGNGGTRFKEWDLLEFSIVPVPANAGALRLAAKALEVMPIQKRGRVLSSKNEELIRGAYASLETVLSSIGVPEEPGSEPDMPEDDPMQDNLQDPSQKDTETTVSVAMPTQTKDPAEPPIDDPSHAESEAALEAFAKALINLTENWSK